MVWLNVKLWGWCKFCIFVVFNCENKCIFNPKCLLWSSHSGANSVAQYQITAKIVDALWRSQYWRVLDDFEPQHHEPTEGDHDVRENAERSKVVLWFSRKNNENMKLQQCFNPHFLITNLVITEYPPRISQHSLITFI